MDKVMENIVLHYLYEDARGVKMVYEVDWQFKTCYSVSDWLCRLRDYNHYARNNAEDVDKHITNNVLRYVYEASMAIFESASALKYVIDFNDTFEKPLNGSELYTNVILFVRSNPRRSSNNTKYTIDTYASELQYIIEKGKPCVAPKNQSIQLEGKVNQQKLEQAVARLEEELEAKTEAMQEMRNCIDAFKTQIKQLTSENDKLKAEVVMKDKKIAELNRIVSEMRKTQNKGTVSQQSNNLVSKPPVESNKNIVSVQGVPNPNAVHIWERYGLKKTTYYKYKAAGMLPKLK